MVISGERVKQAREIKQMTQKRLAELVGVSQAAIAQVESGAFIASDDLVSAIATQTGHPLSFFTQQPGPTFPLGSLLFRSHRSMTKKEMVSTSKSAEQVYELAVKLRARTRAMPVKIPKLSGMDAEHAAREMRRSLSLSQDDPIPHLLNLLEWNGVLVLSISNVKVRDAFSLWFQDTPIIAVARDRPGDRGRLSVSHELGHLVLHHGKSRLEVDDSEADDFAAEFLMPEVAMRREMKNPVTLSSLASIKPRWKVSIQALIRRAKDLSIITDRQYRYLFEQLSAMGWRTEEPIKIEGEKARALRQMAEMIYGSPINFEQLNRDANIDIASLRELMDGYAGKQVDLPKSIDGNLVTMPRRKTK